MRKCVCGCAYECVQEREREKESVCLHERGIESVCERRTERESTPEGETERLRSYRFAGKFLFYLSILMIVISLAPSYLR